MAETPQCCGRDTGAPDATRRALALVVLSSLVGVLLLPFSAVAQKGVGPDSRMEALLEEGELRAQRNDDEVVLAPRIDAINLNVHWRLFKRVTAQGASGAKELRALRHDATSLGQENLARFAMAAVALVQRRVGQGEMGLSEGLEALEAAAELSPDLPYPELAQARLIAAEDPGRVDELWGHYRRGLALAWRWLDTRVAWTFNLGSLTLVAFVLSSLVFLVTQLIRNFGVVAYDVTRLLPRGFSTNQSTVLLLAAVIVPGLLLQSPLLSCVALLALLAPVQNLRERAVSGVLFAALAVTPQFDVQLSLLLSYPASEGRQLAVAEREGCDEGCLAWLGEKIFEGGVPLASAAPELAYSWSRTRLAQGGPQAADEVLTVLRARPSGWPESGLGGLAANLEGVALLSRDEGGDRQAARQVLERAQTALPQSAAPPLNLMRLHQMTGEGEAQQGAMQEALKRDRAVALQRLELQRRDVNSFLQVPPLPGEVIWDFHRARAQEHVPLVAAWWIYVAGRRLPLSAAPWLGGLGLLLLLATLPLRLQHRTSTPCPRCGLPRDPHDDRATGFHHLCLMCYRTFVTGATLTYQNRVDTEAAQNRRALGRTLLRRTLSALLPGSGHMVAGWALAGFGLTFGFTLAGLWLLLPLGVLRPPHEIVHQDWFWQQAVATVVLVVIWLVGIATAARDILSWRTRTPKIAGETAAAAAVARQPEEAEVPAARSQRAVLGAVVLHHAITAALVTALFALGIWGYLSFRSGGLFEAPERSQAALMEKHLLPNQAARVRLAGHLYFLIHDRTATSQEDLVADGLLEWSDLVYPTGQARLGYRRLSSSAFRVEVHEEPAAAAQAPEDLAREE